MLKRGIQRMYYVFYQEKIVKRPSYDGYESIYKRIVAFLASPLYAYSIAPYINWHAFCKSPRRPPHLALKCLTRVDFVRI